jgi:hypothetical protein
MESDDIRSARRGHHGRDGAPIKEPTKSRFTPDPGEIPSPAQVEASAKQKKKRLANAKANDQNVER